MEGTSDPRFGVQGEDQFRYDQLDRATHAGPLRFQYDSSGEVRQVTDGKTTIDYEISGGATIGQKITTTDAQSGQQTSKAVRYSAQGLMLCTKCEKGTAIKRVVNLEGGVVVELPIARAAGSSKSPTPKTKGRKASSAGGAADEANAAQAEAAETWRYSDMLGSTAWQAVGGEAPSQTALYDPDGNQLTTEPPLLFDPAQPNLRFEGTETTPTEIPTLAMGSRTYIPALGVFMQPDPIPNAGPTPYNYANGDPVNFTDPTGEISWCWSTFTKVTTAVVVGAVVGAFTGGIGAAAGGWAYVAAQAGVGLAVGAAGSAAGQGIVLGFDIPDSEGNVQSQFNWAEFARDAGIGAVTAGISARYFAPRPGAGRGGTGKASAPTNRVTPPKRLDRAAENTRKLLMDWDDEYVAVLGRRPLTKENMNTVKLIGFKQSKGQVYAIENVISFNGISMVRNRPLGP
jgi:RHS repeat-associated protein